MTGYTLEAGYVHDCRNRCAFGCFRRQVSVHVATLEQFVAVLTMHVTLAPQSIWRLAKILHKYYHIHCVSSIVCSVILSGIVNNTTN